MTMYTTWIVEIQSVCDGSPYGDPMIFRVPNRRAALAVVRKYKGGDWDAPYIWVIPPEGAISSSGEIFAWREF